LNKYLTFIIFVVLSVLCFSLSSYASNNVEINPDVLYPGDIFYIKINTDRRYKDVLVTFQRDKIYLLRCGKGCFLGLYALDLSVEPGLHQVNVLLGKERIVKEISVKGREQEIQKLTLQEDKISLNKKDLLRVKKEERLLKKIFKKITRRKWNGDFIYPLENDINAGFGVKRILNDKFESIHKGIDIKGEEGEVVMASNSGRVVLVKELFFGGKTVIIDHGGGVYSIYMHLSRFSVKRGVSVSKGNIIGFVGSTGRSTGPHLHFGIKVNNRNANPVSMIELDI